MLASKIVSQTFTYRLKKLSSVGSLLTKHESDSVYCGRDDGEILSRHVDGLRRRGDVNVRSHVDNVLQHSTHIPEVDREEDQAQSRRPAGAIVPDDAGIQATDRHSPWLHGWPDALCRRSDVSRDDVRQYLRDLSSSDMRAHVQRSWLRVHGTNV